MNARTRKVVMVLSVASVVLVWRVYVIITDYMPESAQASQVEDEATESLPEPDMPDPLAAVWEKQRSLEERPWGRNPFEVALDLKKAAVEATEEQPNHDSAPLTPPQIGFSGASRVGNTYRAILKSGIVAVGDSVEGPFTVKAIDKNKLVIASGSWHYIYELGSELPTIRRSGENNE